MRGYVFPAQAGVILRVDCGGYTVYGIPRASGGDPIASPTVTKELVYSPRKRG